MTSTTPRRNVLTASRRIFGIAALTLLVFCKASLAHEFWLEPEDFAPPPGKTLPVKASVGQNFEGESLVYLKRDFPVVRRFAGKRPTEISGTDGDNPALAVFIRERGPQIVTLKSRFYELEFEQKEKFIEYLNLEGHNELAQRAEAALVNPIEIGEDYERNAKLLVFAGGRREGRDFATGLDLEFVIEDGFERLRQGSIVHAKLLRRGRPVAGAPVKVVRHLNRKEPLFLTTDGEGRVKLKLDTPGPWLINSVYFSKMEVKRDGEVKSTWASYVFPVE